MTFYHFCADKHVKKILRQGLTIGALTEPTPQGYIIHIGWIWLTTDPDPNNQSWNTMNAINYSRTAWRLTVDIPDSERKRIYSRFGIASVYPACDMLFKGFKGSESWRVYHGMIPKEWIVGAKEM